MRTFTLEFFNVHHLQNSSSDIQFHTIKTREESGDDDVRFSWRKGIKAKERQYYGEDYSSENIKYRIYNKRYLKFLLKKNWCRGPSKNI